MADMPTVKLGKDPNDVADAIFRWVPLALVAGLCIFGWGLIAPFIATMLASTFSIGLSLIGILVLGVLTIHPQARAIWWLGYNALMHKIRTKVVHWAPEVVVNLRLADAEARTQRMRDIVNQLSGVLNNLIEGGKDIVKRLNSATRRYAAGKDQRLPVTDLQTLATEIGLCEEEQKQNVELQGYVSQMHDLLEEVMRVMDSRVKQIRLQIESTVRRYQAAMGVKAGTQEALAVLRPSPEAKKDYDEAMKFMTDQANMQFGQLAKIQEAVGDTILNYRLDAGAALKGADERLARIREEANKFITNMPVLAPGQTATAPSTPTTAQSGYLNLGGKS